MLLRVSREALWVCAQALYVGVRTSAHKRTCMHTQKRSCARVHVYTPGRRLPIDTELAVICPPMGQQVGLTLGAQLPLEAALPTGHKLFTFAPAMGACLGHAVQLTSTQ